MTKEIIAIWAQDEEGVIGRNGHLPWYLPKELQHFKKTTLHQAIVMGRVTFDGMKKRLLPERQTIVMTSDHTYKVPGVLTMSSLDAVLDWFQSQERTLYVIGGKKVLEAFDGHFDRIIKTVVHHCFEGDTKAPNIDLSGFTEESQTFHEKDDKNPYDFTVYVYVKK
ncbi:dihydrofolate reductase [Streptococcus iniae]|uniref:Dihydrofolate reductase n=1 Tax=Streptococcus iniae TaxID=1346 RepID=A0A1J0MZ54_STRIN|nr:dihydrofolate reductase [Streptococcus iniae]AGM98922.1 dihydrofolate reductase [Streptococcus iniae SF1]AHY15874.1 dihydrofolate reductase [Streptococcus iniae]AHY17742.1 dihydrofolate reductase [Streptococcus iniae]AJG26036.1 dihydrofolate reductase [Streptococcus iniae]APD31913.1 dihydrofolate reductase [Streptococcus iniae]